MEKYFEYKGVYFRNNTPIKLADLLLKIKENRTRIVVDYGDTETGKSWEEIYDVTGTIGKSTGTKPILLLVHNKRSMGGGEISTDKILNIKTSIGKSIVYDYRYK